MTVLPTRRLARRGAAGVGRVLRYPAALIITITGLFHLYRGAQVDGVIFLSVALALLLSDLRDRFRRTGRARAARRLPLPRTSAAACGGRPERRTSGIEQHGAVRGRVLTAVAVVAVAVGYGWAVGRWGGTGWPVQLAVAVPGILAGYLAWPQRAAADRGPTPAGAWMWASVTVLAGLLELTSYLLQQEPTPERFYNHPTASLFIVPLVASQPGHAVGLAVWLIGGYLLLRGGLAANTELPPVDAGKTTAGDAGKTTAGDVATGARHDD